MRSMIFAGALVAVVGVGAGAQAPGAPAEGRAAPGAAMLLARTGELGLTDAQVTRLAAIARRSEARHQAMRASRDSIRTRFGPGNARPDSAARVQLVQRMRADAERMREQERTDRRDAIAVLTADQQARAWEMVSTRGARGMRGPGMGARRPGMMGPGRMGPGRMGMQRRMGMMERMQMERMGERAPARPMPRGEMPRRPDGR